MGKGSPGLAASGRSAGVSMTARGGQADSGGCCSARPQRHDSVIAGPAEDAGVRFRGQQPETCGVGWNVGGLGAPGWLVGAVGATEGGPCSVGESGKGQVSEIFL